MSEHEGSSIGLFLFPSMLFHLQNKSKNHNTSSCKFLIVMKFLGKHYGYKAVAWRAGCWGERGVRSISGFRHIWQLMLLEIDFGS